VGGAAGRRRRGRRPRPGRAPGRRGPRGGGRSGSRSRHAGRLTGMATAMSIGGSGPRVWITRAQPGAARTADRLTALGLEPVIAPLLAIRPLEQPEPDLGGVDVLAFTSPNGVAAFCALTARRDRPVMTVG